MVKNDLPEIHVRIASWQPRHVGLLRRVNEILPQLREKDTLGLWLNNFADVIVQRIPNDPRIVFFRAGDGQPYHDIKSHGKFKNIQDYKGYYLTLDDDIIIPNRYIEVMIEGIEAYHRKAYCTFHGGNFPLLDGKVDHACPRRVCERRTFEQLCQKDELVHIAGNGISGCFPSVLGLTDSIIPENKIGGDDEEIALFCQRNEIPIVRLAHTARWIKNEITISCIGALCHNNNHIIEVDRQILSWKNWHHPKLQEEA
jgi:hypothetical protein